MTENFITGRIADPMTLRVEAGVIYTNYPIIRMTALMLPPGTQTQAFVGPVDPLDAKPEACRYLGAMHGEHPEEMLDPEQLRFSNLEFHVPNPDGFRLYFGTDMTDDQKRECCLTFHGRTYFEVPGSGGQMMFLSGQEHILYFYEDEEEDEDVDDELSNQG